LFWLRQFLNIISSKEKFRQGRLLFLKNAFPGLPDDVTRKSGHTDWTDGITLAEGFYGPFFGLVMDEFVIMAHTGFA